MLKGRTLPIASPVPYMKNYPASDAIKREHDVDTVTAIECNMFHVKHIGKHSFHLVFKDYEGKELDTFGYVYSSDLLGAMPFLRRDHDRVYAFASYISLL